MNGKVLSNEELSAKFAAKAKTCDFMKAGKVELSEDALDSVTGGVDSYAFDLDGYVYVAICNHPETKQGKHMLPAVEKDTVCSRAPNFAGEQSCFYCPHFSLWRTGQVAK